MASTSSSAPTWGSRSGSASTWSSSVAATPRWISSRTALRLGAKTSTILYRRGPDEMVVDEEEQHETRFEGVQFEYFASPVEVLAGPDGKVNGMVFQRTRLGPPDASGRRSAEPIPGSEFTVPCDMVIPCTSQASDNNVLGEFGAKLNRHVGVTDTRSVVEGGRSRRGGPSP